MSSSAVSLRIPSDTTRPLGLNAERTEPWKHIQIQAPELGRLLLDGGRRRRVRPWGPPTSCGSVWPISPSRRTRLAAPGREDPLIVARAIDDQVGQAAYDRVVLDYLANMAEEISSDAGGWDQRARERVSRLVANLHPETLRSLLLAGANHAERRRFVLMASEVFAVDAVVELVEAAALTTGQTISNHLLRLLHKFAQHAEEARARPDGGGIGPPAAGRSPRRRLGARRSESLRIHRRSRRDGPPRRVRARRRGGVHTAARPRPCSRSLWRPDASAPGSIAALDRLGSEHRLGRAAALLATPRLQRRRTRCGATWPRRPGCATSWPLRPVDFVAVEGLALRLGAAAVDPLLDRLETAEDQGTRAKLLKVLGQIGPPAAQAAVPAPATRAVVHAAQHPGSAANASRLARRISRRSATRVIPITGCAAKPTGCCSSIPSTAPRRSATAWPTRMPASCSSSCTPRSSPVRRSR